MAAPTYTASAERDLAHGGPASPPSRLTLPAAFHIIADDMQRVEVVLRDNVRSEVGLILKVGEYILGSGGKRFRPTLVLLSAGAAASGTGVPPVETHGRDGHATPPRGTGSLPMDTEDHGLAAHATSGGHIYLAAAMEYIHTATLLHDDVVDDATVRRGQPSVRAVWDNHVSVLVGDYLFARAFSIILKWTGHDILTFIADACVRMAEGEAYQLQRIGKMSYREEDYIRVVTDKTAGLIGACARTGAQFGGGSEDVVEALHQYGLKTGIAFQMADDALDYTADEAHLGKTIGKDLLEGKVTLPLIHALTRCSDIEKKAVEKVIAGRHPTALDLGYVSGVIRDHGGIEYAYKRAKEFVIDAKSHLAVVPDSPYKNALIALADYTVSRDS